MRKLFGILRKRVAFIILFSLIVELLLVGFIFVFMPERFEANATLMVSAQANNLSNENYDLDTKLIANYRELCQSQRVIERAVVQTGLRGYTLEKLRARTGLSRIAETNLVNITVWDDDPERAALLANSLADVLTEEVNTILKVDNLILVDAAKPPLNPARGHIILILLYGLAASLFISICIALLINYFDDTIRTSEQVATLFGKPVLGQIPHGVTRLRKR